VLVNRGISFYTILKCSNASTMASSFSFRHLGCLTFSDFGLLYPYLCFSSTIKPLTVCRSKNPPAVSSSFNSPGHKNRHPLFSGCRFCYPIVRFDFWRKWRKFGVNPLLAAPKIKDSCGFLAVISTCRPYRPCHRQRRGQPEVPAGQPRGSRWSGPSQRRKLRSPERNG